jgi:transforming growth factor-beta-induced protein
MKPRTSRLALWLTSACLLLAACGDGATTTTSPAAADSSTTEEMMDETTSTEMMDEETTTTEVMEEETMDDDVLAVAEAEGDLGTFLAALDAAGIMEDFHGEGPFTLFVPTDDAFAAYLDQNDMSQEEAFAGAEMLQSILGYHVVTMTEDSEMVMGMDGQTFTTLNGAPLEVSVDGDTVMVGEATILRYDIVASNGVVHVIDTVLAPPEG